MELRASGEDYLETVFILSHRMGRVRAIDVAHYLGFAKPASAMGCGFCTKAVS